MRPSLGIISGSFALRSQPFARDGHVVFYFFAVILCLGLVAPNGIFADPC
jgi:hypothetical protein